MTIDREKNTITLPATGSWPKTHHQWEKETFWAIRAAVAANRPLLVRGEPGTGKSQLARAAAYRLNRAFISEVVHARSECQDLQFHFDAVARLGDAQVLSIKGNSCCDIETALNPEKYISPGVLWWALNWEDAKAQHKKGNKVTRKPERPEGWEPQNGTVLLIDEIDKADADLPNGLLETLANGAFTVSYRDDPVKMANNSEPPLVIITTNEERELPAAFVRRCLVLHLKLPEKDRALAEWLMMRAKVHFDKRCGEDVRIEAVKQLILDRRKAKEEGLPAPGQAEYLDLLRAVIGIQALQKEAEPLAVLKEIQHFAFVKHINGNQR